MTTAVAQPEPVERDPEPWDAVVIGGGFYGTRIATWLRRERRRARVLLLEAEDRLFAHASYNNQARVHGGYHYPRSFTTAYRSRINLPRFVADYRDAVRTEATSVYAIARRNSKVSARQFQRFAKEIGAFLAPLPAAMQGLFDRHCIEAAFLVEEHVFDATRLAARAAEELHEAGVEVRLGTTARSVHRVGGAHPAGEAAGDLLQVIADGAHPARLHTPLVLNCTYARLGQLAGDAPGLAAGLKHELAEIALVQVPEVLRGIGITVMDGPFFSLQPFPARGLHSFTHVRYTPHEWWFDAPGDDPFARLAACDRETRFERMRRDALRYVPALAGLAWAESLYEVKTVLVKNETDDGRPILVERNARLPGLVSVLGGKLDNIYDVLERLDAERLAGD